MGFHSAITLCHACLFLIDLKNPIKLTESGQKPILAGKSDSILGHNVMTQVTSTAVHFIETVSSATLSSLLAVSLEEKYETLEATK